MTRYRPTSPAARVSGDGPFIGDALANQLYQHYFSRLMAVACTRYRWVGLGAHIDPMRVEHLLVTQGLAAFTFVDHAKGEPQGQVFGDGIHDDGTGANDHTRGNTHRSERLRVYDGRFVVSQAMVTGYLDDTFTPSAYRTYAPTGANGIAFNTFGPLETWRGVPIWGDALRSSYDLETISMFARRLAAASLVVDTNLRMTMQGPVVAVPSIDNLKTYQVALEGAMRGVDVMVADPKTLEALQGAAIDFGVHPDKVERSHVVAMRLWSEALEALGVQSPAAEKKERLVVDEIGADNSQVAAVRRLTLTPRRQAASLINRRFFGGAPVVEVVDQWD